MTRAARRLLLPHYCNCTGTGIICPRPLFHALVAIRLAVAGSQAKGGWWLQVQRAHDGRSQSTNHDFLLDWGRVVQRDADYHISGTLLKSALQGRSPPLLPGRFRIASVWVVAIRLGTVCM